MISFTLLTFVVALSSDLAVRGAIIERGGSSTGLMPQSSGEVGLSTPASPAGSTPVRRDTIIPVCYPMIWYPYTTYQRGDQVFLDYGYLYTAKQWTFDSDPSTHPDEWNYDGFCDRVIAQPPPVDCNGYPVWASDQAYTQGNQVVYNGSLWTAKQWTEANSPGDVSDTWQTAGFCYY